MFFLFKIFCKIKNSIIPSTYLHSLRTNKDRLELLDRQRIEDENKKSLEHEKQLEQHINKLKKENEQSMNELKKLKKLLESLEKSKANKSNIYKN